MKKRIKVLNPDDNTYLKEILLLISQSDNEGIELSSYDKKLLSNYIAELETIVELTKDYQFIKDITNYQSGQIKMLQKEITNLKEYIKTLYEYTPENGFKLVGEENES